MDIYLKARIDQLVNNLRIVTKNTKMIPGVVRLYLAFCFDQKTNKLFPHPQISDYIKKNLPWYSYFRDRYNIIILGCLLAAEDDYEIFLNKMFDVYQELKKTSSFGSDFHLLASFVIASSYHQKDIKSIFDKTMCFKQLFRTNHRFLASSYDFINASILSSTDDDIDNMVAETEKCYKFLTTNGFNKNKSVLALSQIMTLSKGTYIQSNYWQVKAQMMLSVVRTLKEKGYRTDFYALPLFGLIPFVDININTLCSDLCEVAEYLAHHNDCFSLWKCSKSNRLLLATALVLDFYLTSQPSPINHLSNNLILKIIYAGAVMRKIQDSDATAAL